MKKCFLHIGNFKTGSTSIQKFLYINSNKLGLHSIHPVYYENWFGETINHYNLYKNFYEEDLKEIKEFFSKIDNDKNIILSSEYFSSFSNDLNKIKFLKETIEGFGYKLIIIFYYRKDSDSLYSLYSEILKQRHTTEIENVFKFKKKVFKYGYYFVDKKSKNWYVNSKYFLDYKAVCEIWKKFFKDDFHSIECKFENNNTIFNDLLKILGIGNPLEFKIPSKKNVTTKIKFWKLKRIFFYFYLKYHGNKFYKK
ncbi:MAG: hypothetical protein CMI79_02550 [Candidatus Pelagibacter sp.]|nr:hypothetical protein [Candidatus Pelagibacter sp.]|tara:strand:+ start:827 stop:1585 length:759 start_codon:yes stop_codon:yes gene_type:complete